MNSIDILNSNKVDVFEKSFVTQDFLKAVNDVFLGSNLYSRNFFLFKDGKSSPAEELKLFDINFITSPLSNSKYWDKFQKKGYSFQIRGLQSLSNFFFQKSLSEFKKTFCLNNYNLYMSPANTNAFKRHKDPYHSIIYFLKGKKSWRFDDLTLDTEAGNKLFIPSQTYHEVDSLVDALHVTSSYYSLPIEYNNSKELINIPILVDDDRSDAVYKSMKFFFETNMQINISVASIFNDLNYLKSHYMFFHVSKPLIYIQGIGELNFTDNNEKKLYWGKLENDLNNADFISDLKDRIARIKS